MKYIDVRELVGGVVLIAMGVFVAVYAAAHYEVGQPARMGPGFFPAALGGTLAALGLIVTLLAFRKSVYSLKPPPFAVRALIAVILSVAAFAALVDRFGLVPAALVSTFIAALAERKFLLRRTLLLAVSLALISWLIFTIGLEMNLPAFTSLE